MAKQNPNGSSESARPATLGQPLVLGHDGGAAAMRIPTMPARRSGRLGLVLAVIAGLATVLPASAHAAGTQTFDTWHMDETSGTTMGDATGSHNGKLSNVELGGAGDPAFPGRATTSTASRRR